MQIVLDTRGLQLSVRNACFMMETESESRLIHPDRVNSILITSPCRISSPALVLAATCQIPVVICDGSGKPMARIWSPRFINISSLRRKQYHFCEDQASIRWAEQLIRLKIEGQMANLQWLSNRKPSLKPVVNKALQAIEGQISKLPLIDDIPISTAKKSLRFYEAFAASQYWQILGITLPPPFTFSQRIKRKPNDGFNTCIN